MTRREKLIDRMRNRPGTIHFIQIDSLLTYDGFVLFNQRGSHCTYHCVDGRVLTIVKPHGGRKTCHPSDVRRLLKVLGHEDDA